jgi:hypothetical protein
MNISNEPREGKIETVVGRIVGPLYAWGSHVHTVMLRATDKKEIPLIVRGKDLLAQCKRNRVLAVSGERNKNDNWGLCAGTAIEVTHIR